MGTKNKIAVLEQDGVEFDVPTELRLNGTAVELDPPIDGHDDVQAFLTNAGSSDHHGGYNLIPASSEIAVVSGKNMISYGVCIEGQLNVEGYLVVEA